MENTKEQKEPLAKKQLNEADRGLNQQLGHKEAKQEAPQSVKSSHHASNKISATIQKMFHTDGQKTEKSSDTESEKTDISSILSVSGHSVTRSRFQKLDVGHIHNLSQYKKGHRVQNFLKELGIHGQQPAAVNEKQIKNEVPLSEKYGKPQEVIGKGGCFNIPT
ncbi:hypothetical protein C1645_63828 [Glomus cerebriforme]|uniref:Uncharacterized protein n=1 Tax=Glomus cerebriforme TaxID=658196 RepID=A0A397TC53_9GLOM|nr:hypothetical protein C1645_63828 [Glomus cerebriforme]